VTFLEVIRELGRQSVPWDAQKTGVVHPVVHEMHKTIRNLLLADDDEDDCIFFKEALESLPVDISLATVSDGEQLMKFLIASEKLPDVLFLDLNMPRKTGVECLTLIKSEDRLAKLSVVIYSTSLDKDVADVLYQKGASYYIRKPSEFAKLKEAIHNALIVLAQTDFKQPSKDKFILYS